MSWDNKKQQIFVGQNKVIDEYFRNSINKLSMEELKTMINEQYEYSGYSMLKPSTSLQKMVKQFQRTAGQRSDEDARQELIERLQRYYNSSSSFREAYKRSCNNDEQCKAELDNVITTVLPEESDQKQYMKEIEDAQEAEYRARQMNAGNFPQYGGKKRSRRNKRKHRYTRRR